MAIIKKDQKAEGQGLPVEFVQRVERAATFQVTSKCFEEAFKTEKAEIEAYLSGDACPVTVTVGEGGGVKVPGVGSLSFSQPERVDNAGAVAAVIAALKAGTIRPDDLSEIISTVKKDGLIKALPEQAKDLVKTSDDVCITLKPAAEFKGDISARITKDVIPVVTGQLSIVRVTEPTPLVAAVTAMAEGTKRSRSKAKGATA